MPATMKEVGIDQWTVPERIALALEIWDSLGDDRPTGHLTEQQRAEIARRDAELDADPGMALSWEQVRGSIEAKA